MAAVALGEPPPFDLIIVADHSDSLAWSRDELASGLGKLLTNVRGRSVNVFVLTPTQYGASSAPARIPLSGEDVVAWQDPETGQPYASAVTRYEQSCTSPDGASIPCPSPLGPDPYRVTGTWSFDPPTPVAVLHPEMTDFEFEQEQATVAREILELSGAGSPNEQPLCTLSRYVSQEPSRLPANAVFLVISDEDDSSTPEECLKSFQGELKATVRESGSRPCSEGCDTYRYAMTGNYSAKRFPFVCGSFDDLGKLIPGTERSGTVNDGTLPNCDGFESGACTPAEVSRVAEVGCAPGTQLTQCQRECLPSSRRCTLEFGDATLDPCTQSFVHEGTHYDNLADYCSTQMSSDWQDCDGGGLDVDVSVTLSGASSRQPLMPGKSAADVGRYFRSRVQGALESGDYLFEAIVFDPSFACELRNGQSYATNIAAAVGDKARLFSLCDSYSPALDGVVQFARGLVQTTFPVQLKSDEQVTGVRVTSRDGTSRELQVEEYAYDRVQQTLTVVPSALRGTDAKLDVDIASDCRPVR